MSETQAFAPGRVELLGNHTDYNGGVVLSAAIQMGIRVAGRRRDDNKIVISSEGLDGEVTADLGDGLQATGQWADYPLGVVAMLREAGAPVGGFEGR